MNIWQQLEARQLGQNYRDTAPRGRGNKAARRAIATARGREHLRDADEPVYTDRPSVLRRGAGLLLIDQYPHMLAEVNRAE